MIKHYKANTAIGVNVVLGGGKNMHVTFTSQSDGSSVYATGDAEVQAALERHYKFGKLFRLVRQESEADAKAKRAAAPQAAKASVPRKVKVSDLGTAKDYLADNFGVSRTSLRSEKAIVDAGRAHGIEFEGL